MEYRIAIVNSSSFGRRFPQHIERLSKIGPITRIDVESTMHGAELARILAPYNVVISSVTPFFDEEFFENKRDLLLISRHGIGYNNIDVRAATRAGCLVTIVSALIERDAVAEASVALLLNAMRHVGESWLAGNEARWEDRASFIGPMLSRKTLGIIGCGNIGSRVAEILGHGFNMRVLACDPIRKNEWAEKNGVTYVPLETLLAEADVISLNASLNPTSFHILSEPEFAQLKGGVFIVNCARGDLIDENAMLAALDNGKVAGYTCDVMHEEPPAPDHPFFNHPKIIVTTHISAYTYECLEGMGRKCVEDVERLVAGAEPVNCVNE